MSKKIIKVTGVVFVLLLFLLFIGVYCPIQKIFGIPCPGCNMTTSLYYLIQGNLKASMFYHAMLIPTMIFGLLIFYCHIKKNEEVERAVTMDVGRLYDCLLYLSYGFYFSGYSDGL